MSPGNSRATCSTRIASPDNHTCSILRSRFLTRRAVRPRIPEQRGVRGNPRQRPRQPPCAAHEGSGLHRSGCADGPFFDDIPTGANRPKRADSTSFSTGACSVYHRRPRRKGSKNPACSRENVWSGRPPFLRPCLKAKRDMTKRYRFVHCRTNVRARVDPSGYLNGNPHP